MTSRIYLDNAASAPLRPEARAAVLDVLEMAGNASSIHAEGQALRFVLDKARRQLGDCLGVRAERVVLTSGGTEANNLALRGVGREAGRLLVSAVEHDCVLNTAMVSGGEVLPVDASGVVRLEALEAELKKGGVALVSVMHANNENGVVQPVAEVAALARAYGALVHCDAVQTVGHGPVGMVALGVDMLSLSAHKFGGPQGVGALVVRSEIQDRLTAQMTGGGQERNRRAGTENVAGAAGMAAALAVAGGGDEQARLAAMNRALVAGLDDLGVPVVARGAARVDHVVQVHVSGHKGEDVVIALDMAGVAVSQGSACGSGRVKASHVLQAMGWDAQAAGDVVRVSLGWQNTPTEIGDFLARFGNVLQRR
ncbi:MAG: cysteine desulfurase [Pseudomonadaceae bacterium]|nr:cysteine desulfurase [Pseudomonadaceae bacterium]